MNSARKSSILHDLRLDLAFLQIEGKNGFPPNLQKTVHVEFRQFQKIETER